MLSALVVLICCAVPAFAIDDVSGGDSTCNAITVKRFSQLIEFAKKKSITPENSHYIMSYTSGAGYYEFYYIFFIPDDFLVDNTLNLTHGKIEKMAMRVLLLVVFQIMAIPIQWIFLLMTMYLFLDINSFLMMMNNHILT